MLHCFTRSSSEESSIIGWPASSATLGMARFGKSSFRWICSPACPRTMSRADIARWDGNAPFSQSQHPPLRKACGFIGYGSWLCVKLLHPNKWERPACFCPRIGIARRGTVGGRALAGLRPGCGPSPGAGLPAGLALRPRAIRRDARRDPRSLGIAPRQTFTAVRPLYVRSTKVNTRACVAPARDTDSALERTAHSGARHRAHLGLGTAAAPSAASERSRSLANAHRMSTACLDDE